MAKTLVKVELSSAQEIALMNRYGRKCSPETLVKRALAEVLRQQEEDVPIFVGKEEHESQLKAAEVQRLAEKAARTPPPEVMDILTRFRSGGKFVDAEGREVSALEPANAHEGNPESLPLMAQFDGDDAEWFPIALDELRSPENKIDNEVDGGELADAPERLAEALRESESSNAD